VWFFGRLLGGGDPSRAACAAVVAVDNLNAYYDPKLKQARLSSTPQQAKSLLLVSFHVVAC
jgi:hypothetical protein